MGSLSVRYAKVLDAAIDKFLPELSLEGRISSILLRLGSHVVAILKFFLLGLPEPFKVLLKPTRFETSAEAE